MQFFSKKQVSFICFQKLMIKLFLKMLYKVQTASYKLTHSLPSVTVIGWHRAFWLYCSALIGQNKGTRRSSVSLSRERVRGKP